jgi:predicted transcriptional regulator
VLSENEIAVLEVLSRQLLARKSEIKDAIGDEPDGVNTAIQRLVSIDFVKTVEPIGERCYVITKKGAQNLKEAKNPEKRAERQVLGHQRQQA